MSQKGEKNKCVCEEIVSFPDKSIWLVFCLINSPV